MSIASPEITTIDRLKQAIWDLHQGTAKQASGEQKESEEESGNDESIMKGTLPQEKYLAGVEQRYLFQGALERVLEHHRKSDPILAAVMKDEYFHAAKAAEDIRFLGGNPIRVRPVEAIGEAEATFMGWASENPALLLGAHYVVEGSNNGARHIARAVRKAYGFEGLDGTLHLDPYGDAQREKWHEYIERVNAADISEDLAERMASSARQTFELLNATMSQAHERAESLKQASSGASGDWLREKLERKLKASPGLKTAMVADALGVPEEAILRAWPRAGEVHELQAREGDAIIRRLEAVGTLYVVCRTAGCVLELSGRFGGFSRAGTYLNVMTNSLHMHVRPGEFGSIFLMERRVREGSEPSLSMQFFDRDGNSAFKAFLMAHNRQEGELSIPEAQAMLMRVACDFSIERLASTHHA